MCKRYILSAIVSVLVLLVMGAPVNSLAIPPDKAVCTENGVYDRLACKQSAIFNQMTYTADDVFGEGTQLNQSLGTTHIKQIKNAKNKAERAKNKNDNAFFKRQAKTESRGNKQAGHLVPFDDNVDDVNQDGICDYEQANVGLGKNARCAAIELDNGQLQICNPEKKNKGKGKANNPKFEGLECDRSTDFEEAENPQEEEDMSDAAGQLEATYDVVEDNLIEMNQTLDVVNETEPTTVFATTSSCTIPSPNTALFAAAIILRHVQTSTDGAARITADVMGQDAVGFNARAGAAAFDAIALVAKLALNAVDDLQQAASAELQNAIMACVAEATDQIVALRADVAALKALMQKEHGDIMANDDENTAKVVQLLNTPQGQRDQFPVK